MSRNDENLHQRSIYDGFGDNGTQFRIRATALVERGWDATEIAEDVKAQPWKFAIPPTGTTNGFSRKSNRVAPLVRRSRPQRRRRFRCGMTACRAGFASASSRWRPPWTAINIFTTSSPRSLVAGGTARGS